MWHDLQGFREWRMLDQALQRAKGQTLAGLVLGLDPQFPEDATPQEAIANLNVPTLTSLDWMRRGMLAERLCNQREAMQAYSASVKVHFNVTSCTALVRLYTQAGLVKLAVQAVTALLEWHDKNAAFSTHKSLSPVVQCAVASLVARHGSQSVLDGRKQGASSALHPGILLAVQSC